MRASVVFPEPDTPISNEQPPSPAKSKSPRNSRKSRKASASTQKLFLDMSIPTSPSIHMLSPQSTTELLGEQSYLMSNLPSQHRRSAGYQQRLSQLETKFKAGQVPSDKVKKTKKEMYTLRKGITEVSEQRNSILGRLGEIYVEMQARQQHWTQTMSPASPFGDWFHGGSPVSPWTAAASPFWAPVGAPPTPIMSPILNAQTPEFIPMGFFGYPMAAQAAFWGPGSDDAGCRPYSSGGFSPASDAWEEDEDATASQPSKSDFDGVDYSVKDPAGECPLDYQDEEDEPLRSPLYRRRSVPCLKSPWSTDEAAAADPFERYMAPVIDWSAEEDSDEEEVEIILDRRG